MGIDVSGPWLHGSPEDLSELRVGSTITRDERLARVFSHKPSLVSVDEHGSVYHNGRGEGILYRVTEPLGPGDLTPVPGSTLAEGKEWLVTRPVGVVAIDRVPIDPVELLTAAEEEDLRRRVGSMGGSEGDEGA